MTRIIEEEWVTYGSSPEVSYEPIEVKTSKRSGFGTGFKLASTGIKLASGGNPMIMIILWAVGLILIVLLILWILNFVSAIMPILIGAAVVLGLGYIIYLVSKSKPAVSNYQPPMESHGDEIAQKCQSMYSNSGDIEQCIRQGGSI